MVVVVVEIGFKVKVMVRVVEEVGVIKKRV